MSRTTRGGLHPDSFTPVPADTNALGSDGILTGLLHLVAHMISFCSAAQQCLCSWLVKAAADSCAPAAAQAAVDNDSGSDVIDLTADDDERADACTMQRQPADHASGQTDDLPDRATSAAETSGSPQQDIAEGSKDLCRAATVEATSTSGRSFAQTGLPDEDVTDLCMLCAYGMDLVAVTSCMLQQVENWPGTHQTTRR